MIDPILIAAALNLAAGIVKAVEGYAKGEVTAAELQALFAGAQAAHDELQAAIAARKGQ